MGALRSFFSWLGFGRVAQRAAARPDARPERAPSGIRVGGQQTQPRGTAPVSASEIFTPTRPRAGRKALVGRQAELARILDAILDETAHVVLYSERGRGKTSLSNLAIEQLRRRGAIVARCACEAETTFDSMMRALAGDLPRSLLSSQTEDADAEGCEAILPARSLRPADIEAIPQHLDCPFIVFVMDEFDRIIDRETRTRLADTIKLVSDRGTRLYFMVVGVSDTLEQIIGQHPSIQRNIVPIHLPLLRDDEIAGMLTKGGQQAGIAFTEASARIVVGVARGMPYMAQLLGLRITQAALRRGDEQVQDADLLSAVQRLLDETSSTVASTYASLLAAAPEPNMAGVLHRLASASQDQWGRMVVLRGPSSVTVGGARIAPATLAKLLEAGVIVHPDGEGGLVQFADRTLIYHVQLLAARAELLGERPMAGNDQANDGTPARLRSVATGG